MESNNRLFYRRKEVAKKLGVSERTVDRIIRKGFLKASKHGHIVLIYAESVTKENILSVKPKFKNQI